MFAARFVVLQRLYEHNEVGWLTVSKIAMNCYKLFFDSRTADSLAGSQITDGFRLVALNRKTMQDEDGIDFFRYPYAFGPKKNNATIVIKLTLNIRVQ